MNANNHLIWKIIFPHRRLQHIVDENTKLVVGDRKISVGQNPVCGFGLTHFWPNNRIVVETFWVMWEGLLRKGCPKKNRTRIHSYCINSVSFCGKSIRSAKSRHDENSKLVKQVYMVQKLPPGSLIRHKTFFCEN